MVNTVTFLPQPQLTCRRNLAEFIRFCREELTVFGAELEFDSCCWDLTEHIDVRSYHRVLLHFTEFPDDAGPGQIGQPFSEPFASFAKSYVRYSAAQRARSSPPRHTLFAFRVVAAALRASALEPDISLVDASVLSRAVDLIRARFSETHGCQVAAQLQRIANFVADKHLSDNIPRFWKHNLSFVRWRNRLGCEFEERRQRKIPREHVLDAVAAAFNLAKEPRDIIVTSILAILCSASVRINEVFSLREACETEGLRQGETAYGLRWAGSKGYPDHIKWVAGPMTCTAREAVRRLRAQTEEARRISSWYEANPGQLYLPEGCEHLRSREFLTTADLMDITGLGFPRCARRWAREAGLQPSISRGPVYHAKYQYRFEDVERAILAMLPKGFPIYDKRTGLRYSEAMLVVRRGVFGGGRIWRCMVAQTRHSHVQAGIAGQNKARNVFERLGLSSGNGCIRVTTHQFRHWLNTIALKGGVSEIDVAAWSGRRDVRQNYAYDHESSEEILERKRDAQDRALVTIRAAVGNPGTGSGAIADLPRRLPVSRDEFAEMTIPNAHKTEIGFCVHDFASAPCPMFMDCLHCSNHVCIKGHDPEQAERVGWLLESVRQSLSKAQAACTDEYEGAAEWVFAHRETAERLEQLHRILTDPTVPAGTVIQLSKSARLTVAEQSALFHEVQKEPVLPSGTSGRGTELAHRCCKTRNA